LPPREFAPRRSWLPANGEAVAVAQVDIGDPRDLLLQAAAINPHEAAQLGQCIAGADAQVWLRGTNLLNKLAYNHASFLAGVAPLPGRSMMLGFRASF